MYILKLPRTAHRYSLNILHIPTRIYILYNILYMYGTYISTIHPIHTIRDRANLCVARTQMRDSHINVKYAVFGKLENRISRLRRRECEGWLPAWIIRMLELESNSGNSSNRREVVSLHVPIHTYTYIHMGRRKARINGAVGTLRNFSEFRAYTLNMYMHTYVDGTMGSLTTLSSSTNPLAHLFLSTLDVITANRVVNVDEVVKIHGNLCEEALRMPKNV